MDNLDRSLGRVASQARAKVDIRVPAIGRVAAHARAEDDASGHQARKCVPRWGEWQSEIRCVLGLFCSLIGLFLNQARKCLPRWGEGQSEIRCVSYVFMHICM